jgi:predicted transglutaminase-like cysteine proteinase
MFTRVLIVPPALCFSMFLPATLDAQNAVTSPPRLQEKSAVLAPFPFIKLCGAHPSECREKSGASEIKLDHVNSNRLEAINAAVNRSIRPRDDPPGRDRWSLDVGSGDCEDYALAKRRALIRSGLPSRAVRLAVGTTSAGEPHALVVVKTDKGDIALDNRDDKPQTVNQVDIVWIKIESSDDPKLWHSL